MVNTEQFRKALKSGDLKAIQSFLKHGFDTRHDFKKGWTALHLASRDGKLEIAQALLDYEAKVNATTEMWRTPLDEALDRGQDAVADLLRKHGGKRAFEASFQGAIAAGHVSWVKKHLAAGAELNALAVGELPLCLAFSHRQWDVAKCLLRNKPDMKRTQAGGETALHVAVKSCAPEPLLKALLRLGADINAKNHYGSTPLSLAAQGHDESAVQFLLANGADPKAGGVGEASPVSAALGNNNHELARFLIDQGAKATLNQAVRCGHLPKVQELVRAGADIENTDSWGSQTPLHMAVDNEHPEIVEFLLECKADPNVQKEYSWGADTPLHMAVQKSSARMVKLLLAGGADPDSVNAQRLTPMELAKQRGNSHLVHLMEAHLDRHTREKAVEQLYTVRKVADLLSVEEGFVLNLLKSGKLRELRLNPETIRIPESSLGHYLSSLEG